MANEIVVLDQLEDASRIFVLFKFLVVPTIDILAADGTPSGGVIKPSPSSGFTVEILEGVIDAAEEAAMDAGALYVMRHDLQREKGQSDAGLLVAVRGVYAAWNDAVEGKVAKLRARYQFYGRKFNK